MSWLRPQIIDNIHGFFGFANFYRQFFRDFSNIIALLTLILKITAFSISKGPRKFRLNKKKSDMDIIGEVSNSRIDDKNVNLSSNMKKINSKAGFLIAKAKLAFTN